MTSRQAYDEASQAIPIEGEVVVSGPDGVAVSLTPRGAKQTMHAAAEAQHPAHEVNLEDQVREAMIAELERQAAEGDVRFDCVKQGAVRINGAVDIDALAMVVVGSLAGGP